MNILLLGGRIYARALAESGHRLSVFDKACCIDENGVARRPYSLESALAHAGFTPDLVLVELFGPRPFVERLESCPFPLATYVFDSAYNLFWLRDYLRLFDHVFVDFRESVAKLASLGIRATWLPYAIHPDDFSAPAPAKVRDVGFVGVTHERPRRQALLQTLREHFHVEVDGGLPPNDIGLREAAEFYAGSRIVINEVLFGDVNFRVFEGMASGSLLLTEATGGSLHDLFTEGVHLATYTPENVVERVRYYLENEAERERIGRAGRERVLREHTQERRVSTMLAELEPYVGRHRAVDPPTLRGHAGVAMYAFCQRWPQFVDELMPAAAQALEGALEAGRRDGRVVWTLGLLHALNGDGRAALGHLNEAAASLSDEPLVPLHMGQILIDAGERELGSGCIREGLRRCAAAPEVLRSEVEARLEEGDLGWRLWLAIGHLFEALGRSIEPNATNFEHTVFPMAANEFYVRSLQIGGHSEPYRALGRCYSRDGGCVLAHSAFLEAHIGVAPDPGLSLMTGIENLRMFRRAEGLQLIRLALMNAPALVDRLTDVPLTPAEHQEVIRATPAAHP